MEAEENGYGSLAKAETDTKIAAAILQQVKERSKGIMVSPFFAVDLVKNKAAREDIARLLVKYDEYIQPELRFIPQGLAYYFAAQGLELEDRCRKLYVLYSQFDGKSMLSAMLSADLIAIIKKRYRRIYKYVESAPPVVDFEDYVQWVIYTYGKRVSGKAEAVAYAALKLEPPKEKVPKRKIKKIESMMINFPIFYFLTVMFRKGLNTDGDRSMEILNEYCAKQWRLLYFPVPWQIEVPEALQYKVKELRDYVVGELAGKKTFEDYFGSLPGKMIQADLSLIYMLDNAAPIVLGKHLQDCLENVRLLLKASLYKVGPDTPLEADFKSSFFYEVIKNVFIMECCEYNKTVKQRYLQQEQLTAGGSNGKNKAVIRELNKKIETGLNLLEAKKASWDIQEVKYQRLLAKKDKALEELKKQQVEQRAEIEYLRELLEQLPPENNNANIDAFPMDLQSVNAKQIMVMGGREDWQARLKQKYPNFSFIGTKEVNYDTGILDKADVIVFNWTYAGHSLYSKLKDYLLKNPRPLVYTRGNEEILLREIARVLLNSR